MIGLVIIRSDNVHVTVAFGDVDFKAAANLPEGGEGFTRVGPIDNSRRHAVATGRCAGADGLGKTQPPGRRWSKPVAAAEGNDGNIDGRGLGEIVDIAATAPQWRRSRQRRGVQSELTGDAKARGSVI